MRICKHKQLLLIQVPYRDSRIRRDAPCHDAKVSNPKPRTVSPCQSKPQLFMNLGALPGALLRTPTVRKPPTRYCSKNLL